MTALILWLVMANGAGAFLADVMLAVDRGRHGTLSPHPLHSWRHTAAAARRRPPPVPARPRHSRRGFAPAQ